MWQNNQGKITEVTGDCSGCVLKQLYEGKEIAPGDPIKKGSKIDLVIGKKETYYVSESADSTNTEENANDFNE